MRDLTFICSIDTHKLTTELKTALTDKIIGVSTLGDEVRVHLDDSATEADEGVINKIVTTHDPTPLPRLDVVEEITLADLDRRLRLLEAR